MKKLLVLCAATFVVVLSSGCAAKDAYVEGTPVQSAVEKSKEMKNEAIVIFNRGVSLGEAEKILESYGMVVVKNYKALSGQNNQLYLMVESSKTTKEMIKTLQNDSAVHSVSANQKRELD